jgi:GGDEF domain-containing protein
MRSSLRSFDPIVRYGGDEFVCAVAGVAVEEVDGRFERIRTSLYADTGASISIGLASLAEHDTLAMLVARADAVLLCAKRGPGPGHADRPAELGRRAIDR